MHTPLALTGVARDMEIKDMTENKKKPFDTIIESGIWVHILELRRQLEAVPSIIENQDTAQRRRWRPSNPSNPIVKTTTWVINSSKAPITQNRAPSRRTGNPALTKTSRSMQNYIVAAYVFARNTLR